MIATDRTRLFRHLESMTRQDRLILILAYAEQLTPAEIALIVEVPESTVLNSLRDTQRIARNILRAHELN